MSLLSRTLMIIWLTVQWNRQISNTNDQAVKMSWLHRTISKALISLISQNKIFHKAMLSELRVAKVVKSQVISFYFSVVFKVIPIWKLSSRPRFKRDQQSQMLYLKWADKRFQIEIIVYALHFFCILITDTLLNTTYSFRYHKQENLLCDLTRR